MKCESDRVNDVSSHDPLKQCGVVSQHGSRLEETHNTHTAQLVPMSRYSNSS